MTEPGPDPRNEIAAMMRMLFERGLTTALGGNVSVRDAAGAIWITPAGIEKGSIGPEHIVRVNTDGSTEGRGEPSSELAVHRHVYTRRPDLGAIIHAHAPALEGFAKRHTVPKTRGCGEIGYARYAPSGTERLGEVVAEVFARGHDCVLMEDHGIVVAGAVLRSAYVRLETLEAEARDL